jgi:DNA-binding GntR family transcriptional regulator
MLIVRSHERIIREIEAKNSKAASRHMRDHRAQIASYLNI